MRPLAQALRQKPLLWGVFGLLAAGCVPLLADPPLAGDSLAYRVELDQGLSVLGGQVLAPQVLQPAAAGRRLSQSDPLAEFPVAEAVMDVVDGSGKLDERFPSFKADAQGRFTLRGLPVNEAVYLRARFKGPDGADRTLFGYARPLSASACATLNFASTLLASHLCTVPTEAFPLFMPAELAKLSERVNKNLPQALAGSLAQGLPALRARLDEVTKRDTPGTCLPQADLDATKSRPPGDLLDAVFAVDPGLPQALDLAVETYLHITLTLQQIGANQASLPRQKQQLRAQTELMTQVPQGRFSAFAYWLNDKKAAEATYADGRWMAKLDTRNIPNGSYVLSAIATPARSGPSLVAASLLVQVANLAAPDPCASPAQATTPPKADPLASSPSP